MSQGQGETGNYGTEYVARSANLQDPQLNRWVTKTGMRNTKNFYQVKVIKSLHKEYYTEVSENK